jgi:uncharacterized protein YoxC
MDKNLIIILAVALIVFVAYTLIYIRKLICTIKDQEYLLMQMDQEISKLRRYIYEKERIQKFEKVRNDIL